MCKLDKDVSDKMAKQALLTEFAACMPEGWVGRGTNSQGIGLERRVTQGGLKLTIPGADSVYVRLENDLLEAVALVAVLDYLKTQLGTDHKLMTLTVGHRLILDSGRGIVIDAPTRIECAVKAMVYVRSLEAK